MRLDIHMQYHAIIYFTYEQDIIYVYIYMYDIYGGFGVIWGVHCCL